MPFSPNAIISNSLKVAAIKLKEKKKKNYWTREHKK